MISTRAASRLPILVCVVALLIFTPAAASLHSATSGQPPRVLTCTTDFHPVKGPSSWPQQAAYGNGSCDFIHVVGLTVHSESIQVSWDSAGTTACPPTPLDPLINGTSCYTDLAVTLNETFADGSTGVRNEIWHFDGDNLNTDPGSVVLIYDSEGRFLGDGEGSPPDGSSFTWRQYGSLI